MGYGFPSGHCTGGCETDSDCAGGGTCVPVIGGGACVAPCESAADCRDGYKCDTDNTCWPGCTSDAQCPAVGTCSAGYCEAPPSPDAGPCAADDDCASGFCITEAEYGFPGGYCSGYCEPDGEACAGGGACIPTEDGGGFCDVPCAISADCRAGYTCQEGLCEAACTSDAQCAIAGATCDVGSGFCIPPAGEGADGETCTADTDCMGLYCLSEAEYPQWVGGYCISLCDPATGEGCVGGGVCADNGGCYAACASDADCRDGYECWKGGCWPQE
ncbi:hypothetical protein SOCE836_042520 [Sorangium cellulosum]|uniref:Uncharacterized protein n=1 Tax=Sorangium cellulosum TaxID=56 RepID=A0A4P2QQ65_SORCE|nr:hypothetical protein SOCE836_042520 [Sorangium cellulosum]